MIKHSYTKYAKLMAMLLAMTLLLTGCSLTNTLSKLPGAGLVGGLIQKAKNLIGLDDGEAGGFRDGDGYNNSYLIDDNSDGSSKSGNGNDKSTKSGTDISDVTAMEGYWVAVRHYEDDGPVTELDYSYPDYFLEFRGDKVTIRDYAREIVLETEYTVTDGGESTGYALLIDLEDGTLSYEMNYPEDYSTGSTRSPYGTVSEFVMRDNYLYYTEVFDYDPENVTEIVAIPTDEGPFDYLQILDDQYLDELQGNWVDPDSPSTMITIEGNTLSDIYVREGEDPYVFDTWTFHVVCDKDNPDYIYLIQDDLVETYFGGYSEFSYYDGKLHTYEMIYDAEWDTSLTLEKVTGE